MKVPLDKQLQVCEAYLADKNVTLEELAKQFELSKTTVDRIARRFNLSRRRRVYTMYLTPGMEVDWGRPRKPKTLEDLKQELEKKCES